MKNKTFAVMLPIIETLIKEDLLMGLKEYANENNIHLLFFCGSPLYAYDNFLSEYNSIYYLLNTKKIDGLIVFSGTLFTYVNPEEALRFLDQYNEVPIITTTIDFKKYPCVIIDNFTASKKLTDHLINLHACKRFAYIAGPSSNPESIARFEGFKESLYNHDIHLDPSLVYEGNFRNDIAYTFVDQLYLENTPPDCVICGNDQMAMGVYERLKELYPTSYNEFKVIGFDNIPESNMIFPPITTAEQPLYELGYSAIELLDHHINNKFIENKTLACKLKIRQSCGCFQLMNTNNDDLENLLTFSKNSFIEYQNLPFESKFSKSKKEIIDYFYATLEIKPVSQTINHHLDKLLDKLCNDILMLKANGEYITALNKLISSHPFLLASQQKWSSFFYSLKEFLFLCTDNADYRDLIYQIIFLSNSLTSKAKSKISNYKLFRSQVDHFTLLSFNQKFSTILTNLELYTNLEQGVKSSNFSTFIVCLYEDYITSDAHGNFDYPDNVKIYFNWDQNKHFTVYENTIFKTSHMLPPASFEDSTNHSYAFYPIVYRNHHFGYVITDIYSIIKVVFKSLVEVLANTLERMLLYNEIDTHNKQLYNLSIKDELTQLFNRRGFYILGQELYDNSCNKKESLAVLYIDMDGLKIINDQFGHDKGDYAIKTLADFLILLSPDSSVISRIGGDEYAIISSFKDNEVSNNFCIQFQNSLEDLLSKYNQKSNNQFSLNASVGYSTLSEDNPTSFEDLLRFADKKLYRNKRLKYSKLE